jgi:hypothetical protein
MENKMNEMLWKDKYREYEVSAVQTDYGAIIAWWGHTYKDGICQSKTWWGGFENLADAKNIVEKSVDEDIVFQIKFERATKAFDLVMAEA